MIVKISFFLFIYLLSFFSLFVIIFIFGGAIGLRNLTVANISVTKIPDKNIMAISILPETTPIKKTANDNQANGPVTNSYMGYSLNFISDENIHPFQIRISKSEIQNQLMFFIVVSLSQKAKEEGNANKRRHD